MFVKSIVLLVFFTCFVSKCFCGKVKSVTVADFQKYNRICTDEVLKTKIGEICGAIKDCHSGACVPEVIVKLKDGKQEKKLRQKNVLICYDIDGKPYVCVTGYNSQTNGLIWDYSTWDVACIPDNYVSKLLAV